MEERNPLPGGTNEWKNPFNTILERFKKFRENIKSENRDTDCTYIENEKLKKALAVFMILTIVAIGYAGYKVTEIKTRAFEVYLGENPIGIVRTEEEALKIISEVKSEIANEYNAKVVIDKEIKFEPTHARDSKILSGQDLKNEIKSNSGFLVSGFAITIDGEEVGVLKKAKEAEELLEKIKEPYMEIADENVKVKDIQILEEIDIVPKEVTLDKISTQEELIEYIKTGSDKIKTHTVEVGESFWTIAKIYGIPVGDLEKANIDKDPTKLKPGDEVKLIVPTSKITVATVEEVEYTENINYEVKVEYDDNMYKNQKKVKVEGSNGESKILAQEIKHNGVLVEKEILNEEIIKEPVDQIVVKGTKEVPRHVATGAFMMPTRGRISSRYGMRWGRMHKGLDIAAPQGTHIKAADGGTVSFAGYKGSYGYMVEINHGNGYKTRYAHCSKIHVKVGQKVAKGQHIANVGNTGRSTGSHLHFEVLKNGVNQNPSNFVR